MCGLHKYKHLSKPIKCHTWYECISMDTNYTFISKRPLKGTLRFLPHSPVNHCLHFLKPTLYLDHWSRTKLSSSSCRHFGNFISKGLQSSFFHGFWLITGYSRSQPCFNLYIVKKRQKRTKSATCAYKEMETWVHFSGMQMAFYFLGKQNNTREPQTTAVEASVRF